MLAGEVHLRFASQSAAADAFVHHMMHASERCWHGKNCRRLRIGWKLNFPSSAVKLPKDI
jgi:hypothetical protein